MAPTCFFRCSHTIIREHIIHTFPRPCPSPTGPGAYAPDAPQPIGLLCDPENPPRGLVIPTSAARCLHVHTTQDNLAAKEGTVGKNVG
jgi:hypothetical protein